MTDRVPSGGPYREREQRGIDVEPDPCYLFFVGQEGNSSPEESEMIKVETTWSGVRVMERASHSLCKGYVGDGNGAVRLEFNETDATWDALKAAASGGAVFIARGDGHRAASDGRTYLRYATVEGRLVVIVEEDEDHLYADEGELDNLQGLVDLTREIRTGWACYVTVIG